MPLKSLLQKPLLFSLLFIFSWEVANAQYNFKKQLEEHYQILSFTKNDTTRIQTMLALSGTYRSVNLDSALYYASKALKISSEIGYKKGESDGKAALGSAYNELGEIPKALALEFEALSMKDQENGPCKWDFIATFITRIYTTLEDYDKALYYAKKQIKRTEMCDADFFYPYLDLAIIFEKTNQLDSARFYLNKLFVEQQSTRTDHPVPHLILGNINAKSGKGDDALQNYKTSYRLALEGDNYRTQSQACLQMARWYQKHNQTDTSIYFALKSLDKAQTLAHKKTIMEAAFLLSELYESSNSAAALGYYKLASSTKESMFGAGNMQAIQAMIAQEDARHNELENARITYQSQMRQYGLLGALGVFLLVSTGLYRNVRREAKAKKLLQEKNNTIQKNLADLQATQAQLIQSEKLASLGELTAGIAHEIQNPLNFVNNFSELSVDLAEELKQEIEKLEIPEKDKAYVDEILGDLSQNQQKINLHGKRASSIVTGMLQHARTSTGKKEPTDINALADEYLRLSYHGLRAKDPTFNAKMTGDFDPAVGKLDVIPQDIGRVLLNLINNAFYAVSQRSLQDDKYEPTVTVSTKKLGDKVEIRVQDNGTGIPESVKAKIFQPFFTTKPTGQGTGLGLSLAYDIVVKGHGGALEVETKEGEGTVFVIQVPIS